jgi:hypothetical protein
MNESLNALREKSAQKNTRWHSSWACRAAFSILQFNEPGSYIQGLINYLAIQGVNPESLRLSLVSKTLKDVSILKKKKRKYVYI